MARGAPQATQPFASPQPGPSGWSVPRPWSSQHKANPLSLRHKKKVPSYNAATFKRTFPYVSGAHRQEYHRLAMAVSCPLKLPAFLELRQTPNRGRGIFTTKRIYCGEEFLRCKPYGVGVCAASAEGLKEMCHFCLKNIPTGSAVMCDRCNAVAYCTTACRDEARRVHRVECEGLLYIEGERGKQYRTFSESTLNYGPPARAVATACALNRRVMDGKSEHEWEFGMISKLDVSSLRGVGSTKHNKEIGFKGVLPYIRKLILTTEEMSHAAHWTFAVNARTRHASAVAVFIEFSLRKHCCVPNCMHSIEAGALVVSAVRDIKAGQE